MEIPEPRISVPATATKGEVIEIRTLVSHPMNNGYTYDRNGVTIRSEEHTSELQSH